MKRCKARLEDIDEEFCRYAIKKAGEHKKHRYSVRRVVNNLDKYAPLLMKILHNPDMYLRDGKYRKINEGTRKKDREICMPSFFPEQCVHWAVMILIKPWLRKRMYIYSCACLEGRGVHYAQKAVNRYCRNMRESKYCLQLDIRKFYQNIDKDILIGSLYQEIKDKRLVAVLKRIIYSYGRSGMPLGFYTSAHLANFYLAQLDRYIKETLHIKRYVRYADDIPLLAANKRKLHKLHKKIEEVLLSTRNVMLKSNWQVYKMPYRKKKDKPKYEERKLKKFKERRRPLDFLGFKFYRYKSTVRKRNFLSIRRNFLAIQKGKYTLKNARRFYSYKGMRQHTDSANLTKEYINRKINIIELKEIIRNESRKQVKGNAVAGPV